MVTSHVQLRVQVQSSGKTSGLETETRRPSTHRRRLKMGVAELSKGRETGREEEITFAYVDFWEILLIKQFQCHMYISDKFSVIYF